MVWSAQQRARRLGSYELEELLGRGGMGEVWRARHRLLVRRAAIKLIRPEVLGGDEASRKIVLARFEREAQATASLRSPHTVELYDFGVSDTGAFYYVMELLDGLDLTELVDRSGPLPPERVVHVLGQMCDSLGEAHAAGLVHRDIKPSNVLLCRHGRAVDFVKILDFGLVKPRDGGGEQLTADHVVSGTPAFMAPEQILGDRPIDARTDLYAVGCVAYWLLTGHHVFDGANAMQVMTDHARSAPSPPSARVDWPVPEDLERLMMACLEKDPDERPPSADALAERLGDLAVGAIWTPERAREWWDRHEADPLVDELARISTDGSWTGASVAGGGPEPGPGS
jgi:serine/threonine-protein kinase